MDDAMPLFSFGFFLGDDDALSVEVNMPGFDVPGFLGPAAGMPGEEQKVAKWIILLNQRQVSSESLGWHRIVAPLGCGLLDFLDGAGRDVAHLLGPVEWALNRNNRASLVGTAPVGMPVDPLDDVEWLETGYRHGRGTGQRSEKSLQVVLIPLEGAAGTIFLAPVEILVENLDHQR